MLRPELRFHDLCFSWEGAEPLVHERHRTIPLEGVTALCGPNGCGKSTLLDLLAGILEPTEGRIVLPRGGVRLVRQRLADDREASPGEFQRERLAEALRDDGELLLLDEPTNHLDRESLGHLERGLRRRASPTLLVSHDRDLLDRLATTTLWMERGELVATPGGFTAAWEARTARLEGRIRDRESHDAHLRAIASRLQEVREAAQGANRHRTAGRRMKDPNDRDATSMAADFRFRSAQARKGQDAGRLRRELERTRAAPTVSVQRDSMRDVAFPWNPQLASRRLALPAGRLEGPGGSGVVHGGIVLDGRTRVRLEGPNGAGKSTVLAALGALGRSGVGSLPQESTREEDRLFLAGIRELPSDELGRILSLASALGASGEALRRTSSPSPGEARKIRLARLLASPSWILLLDEPTNHLDAASIQRLEEALARWPGGLVLATHDDRLAAALSLEAWSLREGVLAQR